MILIVGAAASGKREYAETLGYDRADMADAVMDARPVLFNLQDLVMADPDASQALFEGLLIKDVVICNEVGSGVIPAASEQRLAREATGRLCNRLAARAERVVRMVCGIPTVIK